MSDWSSDVCPSVLSARRTRAAEWRQTRPGNQQRSGHHLQRHRLVRRIRHCSLVRRCLGRRSDRESRRVINACRLGWFERGRVKPFVPGRHKADSTANDPSQPAVLKSGPEGIKIVDAQIEGCLWRCRLSPLKKGLQKGLVLLFKSPPHPPPPPPPTPYPT